MRICYAFCNTLVPAIENTGINTQVIRPWMPLLIRGVSIAQELIKGHLSSIDSAVWSDEIVFDERMVRLSPAHLELTE